MIGALREPRDGSASDDARTMHANRKRPAVRGKVRNWQSVFFKKGGAHVQANSVRAPMKSRHQIALAAYPLGVVRCAAGKGRVEERMPKAADVDREACRVISLRLGYLTGRETEVRTRYQLTLVHAECTYRFNFSHCGAILP